MKSQLVHTRAEPVYYLCTPVQLTVQRLCI